MEAMSRRLGSAFSIVTCLGLVVVLAPGAAAHPADAFAFGLGPLAFPNGLPPITPPSMFLAPISIRGVTASDFPLPGFFTGTGQCNVLGEGCATLPVWNAFLAAPVMFFDCEITAAFGPWPGLPAVFLAQDIDGSGTIDALGPDLVVTIGMGFGSPFGPIPPVIGPAGAYGGSATLFAGGPFLPGVPIHFIAAHPGIPLTPLSAALDLTVECWVI